MADSITPERARELLIEAGISPDDVDDYAASWEYFASPEALVVQEALSEELFLKKKAALTGKPTELQLQTLRKQSIIEARGIQLGIAEGELSKIGATIADGVASGQNSRVIARNLDMVTGLNAPQAKSLIKFREGLEANGFNEKEINKLVDSKKAKMLKRRKETIARTEVRNSQGVSKLSEAKERGVKKKSWVTAGDLRVSREICQLNEQAGPIDIDKAFPSGHQNQPGHPNCRCTVTYHTSDKSVEIAEERSEIRSAELIAKQEAEERLKASEKAAKERERDRARDT